MRDEAQRDAHELRIARGEAVSARRGSFPARDTLVKQNANERLERSRAALLTEIAAAQVQIPGQYLTKDCSCPHRLSARQGKAVLAESRI